ncbi:MAG: hypothetical protein JXA10_18755 [Anaerolineae bacterium]|nr:hypothetical protein [Anaerolineae bacterium]
MGIYRLISLVTRFFYPASIKQDVLIDSLIQDALFDDALACPAPDAWERLRQIVMDRQLKHYGMWVLDEPQRDPPDSSPMPPHQPDFERARRFNSRYPTSNQILRQDMIWGGLSPTFSIITDW